MIRLTIFKTRTFPVNGPADAVERYDLPGDRMDTRSGAGCESLAIGAGAKAFNATKSAARPETLT